ncbi:MFS transporter [Cellulomonas composti]|uniref:MFS transporter n=1 Tax=Cellulomonas composti TaxID=266130 RepID=A0A511J9P3_9CELL|nr:MFS transporter [Cellulomonas composti]GEL94704.1 MFS transporter [Cellulomonas composti]
MTVEPHPVRPSAHHASRVAIVVYLSAVFAYFVAVLQRTALGVAGVEAIERFSLGATGLALFSVVQLTTYAVMQIPAGRLLDRFGARWVIGGGSAVMAVGQLVLALAHDVPMALLARLLIGAGDAGIFISAIRLVAQWFPGPRAPVLVQVTGLIGQSGQLASAIPLAWLLHARGWTPAFGVLAVVGAVAATVAFVGVREPRPHAHNAPDEHARPDEQAQPDEQARPEPVAPRRSFVRSVRIAIDPPGTRLGYWSHFATPFSANVVSLLWGVPFFVTAQGRTKAEAGLLLTVLTLTAMVAGPLIGRAAGRHPLRRTWLVLGSCAATLAAWVVLLSFSTPRPLWQLAVFCAVVGAGGPVSLVGMDFARTFTPTERLGTASGFVNTGGFTSTIGSVLAVGIVLQVLAPPGASTYTLDQYRVAFAVLLVPWLVGVWGVVRNRNRTRAAMARDGVVVPPFREALRRGRH